MRTRRQGDGRALVALPVFNECEYVDDVVRAVRLYAEDILVVDDGSTDGTGRRLDRLARLHRIKHAANLGYGRSLIDAFGYAREHHFPWIVTMDCDRQHEPSCIPRFFSEIESNAGDIISGSRYLQRTAPSVASVPAERLAINRAVTGLLNAHLHLRLTDAFCGFKAYRTEAVTKLALAESGYAMPLQLWVQASRAGLKIREIPVPLIYHDPRRRFAGDLEDPRIRMQYYVTVLERELGYQISHEVEELLPTPGGTRSARESGVFGVARLYTGEPGDGRVCAGPREMPHAASADR